MPRFRYQAAAADGEILHGELEAADLEAAVDRLQRAGHVPLDMEACLPGATWERTPPTRRGRNISQREVLLFTRQLANLLRAGLPLDSALETIRQSTPEGNAHRQLRNILERLREGLPLSEALAAQGTHFSPLYLGMLRAGEAAGAVHHALHDLAAYLEHRRRLQGRVLRELWYPGLLLVVGVLSLSLLLLFVVPQFAPLFSDLAQEPPWVTRLVLALAEFLRTTWWLWLLAAGALSWGVGHAWRTPTLRASLDRLLLRLPWLGELLLELEVSRFTRTLGALLRAGVALPAAVTLAGKVLGNQRLREAVAAIGAPLEQGRGLSQPLRDDACFPIPALRLIQAGEEAGHLEEALLQTAEFYEEEAGRSMQRILAFLGPTVILGLGGFCALVMLSMWLALLSLNSLVL